MLEEAHQNLEELRRVFAGQGAPGEVKRITAHLTGCRECWLLASRAIAAQKASGAIAIRGPVKPLIDLHEMEQARLESLLEAQSIWAEIRSLSFKARRDKIRLTRALHNRSFLEVLLEEGTAAAPADAIAVCLGASQELSLMADDEGSGEPARAQMQRVWHRLEEEVRRGTVSLGAPEVLRGYIKAHWRFLAPEIPAFGQPC